MRERQGGKELIAPGSVGLFLLGPGGEQGALLVKVMFQCRRAVDLDNNGFVVPDNVVVDQRYPDFIQPPFSA